MAEAAVCCTGLGPPRVPVSLAASGWQFRYRHGASPSWWPSIRVRSSHARHHGGRAGVPPGGTGSPIRTALQAGFGFPPRSRDTGARLRAHEIASTLTGNTSRQLAPVHTSGRKHAVTYLCASRRLSLVPWRRPLLVGRRRRACSRSSGRRPIAIRSGTWQMTAYCGGGWRDQRGPLGRVMAGQCRF